MKKESTFSDFKVQQRGESLRFSWVINENERTVAFKKKTEVGEIQDYFVLKETRTPLECPACDSDERPPVFILFSSDSIIREGDHFYYYSALPENFLNLHTFELSHLGPDDGILSSPKTVKFKHNKLFPKVPSPKLKIIQIEDEKKTVRFPFGKVVLTKTNFLENDELKLESGEKTKDENSEPNLIDKQKETRVRTFVIRLSWPQMVDKGLKRFQGEGSFFEEQNNFRVNLYRMRNGDKWPEIPLFSNLNQNNYYLDKLKLKIYHVIRQQLKDDQEYKSSEELPFYVDLQGQNGDTWLYQLRLVDRFGNESLASKTVTLHLPKVKINGHILSQNTDVPSVE